METTHLLKQEINQTLDSLHDFAKWKLIVTSALAGAALGLNKDTSRVPPYWLLLFIPYVCAYVDLNCYQYLIRITAIARWLREHGEEDKHLKSYERLCEQLRVKYGIFNLGQYAGVGASLTISILAPAIAVHQFAGEKRYVGVSFWAFGIALIIALWLYFRSKNKDASTGEIAAR
ncbi:MAG TPA: hypothetical protein VEU31_11650 [Candidatus Acidoferrales bacterium]|nr:hypothetical protein [Candidatus Acidoferrales bacterium]